MVLCLGGVWLATTGLRTPGDAGVVPPVDPRVLIVGVDGLDWARARSLVAEGRMPNLDSLMDGGSSGPLRSIAPYASPTVWTSVATGKTAESHGVEELGLYGGTGDRELAGSLSVKCMTLWEILASTGRTSGVVGWLATYPPVPVTSYTVTFRAIVGMSGGVPPGPRGASADLADAVYPAEIWGEMAELGITPEGVPEDDILALLSRPDLVADDVVAARTGEIVRWLAADRTTVAAAKHLMTSRPTDLVAVYLRGNDIVSHLFWRYMEPESWTRGPVRQDLVEAFASVVDRYYEEVDGFLGEILEVAGDDVAVIVCSDHGFVGHRGRPGFVGDVAIGIDMHGEDGLIVMKGPGISRGGALEGAGVLDVAPTALALLGVPVGLDMDGSPLVAALTPSFLEQHPITHVDTYETDDRIRPQGTSESPVDEEIKELLKSIGYVN